MTCFRGLTQALFALDVVSTETVAGCNGGSRLEYRAVPYTPCCNFERWNCEGTDFNIWLTFWWIPGLA